VGFERKQKPAAELMGGVDSNLEAVVAKAALKNSFGVGAWRPDERPVAHVPTSSSKSTFTSSSGRRPELLDAPDESEMVRTEPPTFELVERSWSTESELRIRPEEPVLSLLLRRALDDDGSELLRFFAMGDSNDDIIEMSEMVQGCRPVLMRWSAGYFNIGVASQPRRIDRIPGSWLAAASTWPVDALVASWVQPLQQRGEHHLRRSNSRSRAAAERQQRATSFCKWKYKATKIHKQKTTERLRGGESREAGARPRPK
jgi:hypothetical protein